MPKTIRPRAAAHAVIFSPLDGAGRAEVVEQRLGDAILLGVLDAGERLPSEAELARQLNVATVTAREALESLRLRGLVETRRGRGGGSFVRVGEESQLSVLFDRVARMSRVDLRDLGVHYTALAAMAAQLAARSATADDCAALLRLVDSFDLRSGGGARRAENTFRLEVASLSQSARLVREHLRVQAEFGPILWLNLTMARHRESSNQQHRAVVAAIAAENPEGARHLTEAHIGEAVEWLIEAKAQIESEG